MSDKQSAEKALEKYKEQKANILGPSTNIGELSEFHKVVIDSVLLSINPKDGDIYKYKDGFKDKETQYIISGQGLQKLAVCAGISWLPNETRATAQSQNYVAYRAVGSIRKADGASTAFLGEYDIDMGVVESEIQEHFTEKRKKWDKLDWFKKLGAEGQNDYIETQIRKEIRYKQKHKTTIAASGAKNRVIRALLSLRKTYTIAELKKPFIIPRIILAPNYKDPDVKRMMLAAAINAQTSVFGASPSRIIEDPLVDIPPEDFHEVPPDDEDPPPSDDDQTPEEEEEPESPTAEEVFKDLSAKEQVETLTQMAKAKGYEPKQPIKNLGPKDRLSFFAALEQMPDVEATPEEDIPY